MPLTEVCGLGLLLAYPGLVLSVQHGVTAAFFLLVAILSFSLWHSGAWRRREIWDNEAIAFTMAMLAPILAVLLSQIARWDFTFTPYEAALRFAIAVPIYLGLRLSTLPIMHVLEYAFAVGPLLTWILLPYTIDNLNMYRLSVWFLNPIHYGNLALILGLFSLFSYRINSTRPVVLRVLQVLGTIAGLYLTIRSGTRGGLVAVPFLLLIWYTYQPAGAFKPKNTIVASLAVLAVILLGYLTLTATNNRLTTILSELTGFFNHRSDTGIGIRLQIWQATIRLFIEHPLFGLGLQDYRDHMYILGNTGIISKIASVLGNLEIHQQILSYAVQFGILGLVAILAVHIVPLTLFIRRARLDASAQAGLVGIFVVISFMVFGLTIEIFINNGTLTFYSLTVAALLAATAPKTNFS